MPIDKHGSTYRARVSISGERAAFNTWQTNRKAAEQVEARYRMLRTTMPHERALTELLPESQKLTIELFREEFLANRRHHGGREDGAIRQSTMRFYGVRLDQMQRSRTLGKMPLAEIDQSAVTRYITEREHAGIYAVNRDIQVLKTMLRVAADLNKIPAAPRIKGKAGEARTNEDRKKFVVPIEELKKYLAVAHPLLVEVVRVMFETGLRPNEVARLKPAHLDLKARSGIVVESKSRKGRRPFRYSADTRDMLAARMRQRGEYVFDIPGRAIESKVQRLSHLHSEARTAAGVSPSFRLYSLRHTLATLAATKGLSAFEIQDMFGWSDPAVAQIYVDRADADKLTAYDRVQRGMPKLLRG